jgi:glyoxylase-like metal-dependent hydrolase (beta-lactamase superfamily II)
MVSRPHRRDILKAALGGAASLPLLPAALARAASKPLSIQRLGKDIAIISGAGGNVVVAGAGDELVMVDGGSADRSKDLLATVAKEFGNRPIRTLFNSHWHPEQTGSNLALAKKGTTIVSHVNTKLWLGTDIHWPWNGKTFQPLPAEARPTKTFYDTDEMAFGSGKIKYGYMLQAHTDGDIYVYFPEANVLAAGGALATDRWPFIDWWTGGWMGGHVEGLETLLQLANDDTRIVPADGPVIGKAELQKQRDMFADLFVTFRDKLLFKGLSPAEAVAAKPTAGMRPDWDNPDEFVKLAFESYWGYYAQDA